MPHPQPFDKKEVFTWLSSDPFLHLYKLGDLDDRFFDLTKWYLTRKASEITSIITLYFGLDTPSLLAATHLNANIFADHLDNIKAELPPRFHVLTTSEFVSWFRKEFRVEFEMIDLRMGLTNLTVVSVPKEYECRQLRQEDQQAIFELLKIAYPTPFFDPSLVALGGFQGTFFQNQLVAIAGVHTMSHRWQVAALGNIATHPNFRRRGLCRLTTSQLCKRLLPTMPVIGLNVHSTNHTAIASYESIGFVTKHELCELQVTAATSHSL